MADINSRINGYQIKSLQHLGRMEQNRFSKLLPGCRPKGAQDLGHPYKRWRELNLIVTILNPETGTGL
jgi:hypothetical protein